MLGGDHTITLAALRSTINHWGVLNVIHFDSHIDTWDPNVIGESDNKGQILEIFTNYSLTGGGVSEYA
jgi:arginase family enzyme